jgi:hypothetical protein
MSQIEELNKLLAFFVWLSYFQISISVTLQGGLYLSNCPLDENVMKKIRHTPSIIF